MAVFDATIGGADATSYQPLADADALYAGSLIDSEWLSYDDATRQAGLMAAATTMDTLDWDGDRCGVPASSDDPARPQSLAWPRSNVTCRGITATCSFIPPDILQAQAYLALQYMKDPSLINLSPNPVPPGLYVQNNTLGDLSQTFAEYTNTVNAPSGTDANLLQKFPFLVDFVGCYLKSSNSRIVARVRS